MEGGDILSHKNGVAVYFSSIFRDISLLRVTKKARLIIWGPLIRNLMKKKFVFGVIRKTREGVMVIF